MTIILSLLTPVKNEEVNLSIIKKIIESSKNKNEYEWIFVDDHSTDNSWRIIEELVKKFENIKLFKNSGKGKIEAINQCFKNAQGKHCKLVGGDDEINLDIVSYVRNLKNNETLIHSAQIFDETKKKIVSDYYPPSQIIQNDLNSYLKNFTSCPSWNWIFPREVAKKFFPIPNLNYEDLYLSFCFKKFTKINYLNKKDLYLYKQNSGQTYGNIMKFDKKNTYYRFRRAYNSLTKIKNLEIFSNNEKLIISRSRLFFYFFLRKKKIWRLIFSKLDFILKLKYIIIVYFSIIYPHFLKIKFKYDKFINFFVKN